MTDTAYPLLDHCNRRNAAELARADLDARQLKSAGWAPSSEQLIVVYAERGRIQSTKSTWGNSKWQSLGYGDRICCASNVVAPEAVEHLPAFERSKRGFNVCHPFDETHLESGEWWEWKLLDAPASKLFPFGWARCHEFNGGGTDPLHTGRDKAERIEPPNHGHGAPCGCAPNHPPPRPKRNENESDVEWVEHISAWEDESTKRRATPVCRWCADGRGINTGRVICDDERARRVSPSHAAGGYAEWQRCNAELGYGDVFDEAWHAAAVAHGNRP